jgi:hypothetical protein
VKRAADQLGIRLVADPFPEEVLFVRSDQYSFVRRGVPSLFLFMGLKSDSGVDAAARFQEFGRTRYHLPQDDLSQTFDLKSGARHAPGLPGGAGDRERRRGAGLEGGRLLRPDLRDEIARRERGQTASLERGEFALVVLFLCPWTHREKGPSNARAAA